MLFIIRISSAVSAETLQKNLDQMGRQIKNLKKDLETFPPPQSDKDLFVEKMSISSLFSQTNRPYYFSMYDCSLSQIQRAIFYVP